MFEIKEEKLFIKIELLDFSSYEILYEWLVSETDWPKFI